MSIDVARLRGRASLLAALLMVPVPVAVGQDPVAVAESEATTDAASAEGKTFSDVVGQAFGREHAVTIQQCAKSAKRRDLANFDVLLRIDGSGVVDQALVTPATSLSICVQGKLTGWKISVPPRAGFWAKVAVNLKGKS